MAILILVSLLLSVAVNLEGAERPVYEVHPLSIEPLLDGKVSGDPGWQGLPGGTGFRRLIMVNRGMADESWQTQFRMGVTAESLYMAFTCLGPKDGPPVISGGDDNPAICVGDSVEVFLFPDEAEEHYQFMIGAGGARWNGRTLQQYYAHRRKPPMPLANWEASSFTAQGYYSLEVRIPFDVLGGWAPEKGEVWRGNVCRNAIRENGNLERSSWSEQEISYHDDKRFGRIVFVGSVTDSETRAARISAMRRRMQENIAAAAGYWNKIAPASDGQFDWPTHTSLKDAIRAFRARGELLEDDIAQTGKGPLVFLTAKQLLLRSKELGREADVLAKRVMLRQMLEEVRDAQ